MESSLVWPENLSQCQSTALSSSALNFQLPAPAKSSHSLNSEDCYHNIFQLLVRREVSPRSKHCPKKRFWQETAKCRLDSRGLKSEAEIDPRQGLVSWVEAESLLHLSSRHCPLLPAPRSTIAAAFSSNGKILASTHGDHTVKIIDSQTSNCLKVLSGHRRTPWVVRFHPLYPELLASGSLDHEVRLWNVTSADCIGSHDFYRPIASIAFHAEGEFLAVAAGHKLYIWHYNRRDEASSPKIILKTRRSLRAVHFHPYAAPLLLTAEVNELDSSDSSMTVATSAGYLHYPPPTMYLADGRLTSRFSQPNKLLFLSFPFLVWPLISHSDGRITSQQSDLDESGQVDSSTSLRDLTYSNPSGQNERFLSPMESNGSPIQQTNSIGRETEGTVSRPLVNAMDTNAPPEHNNPEPEVSTSLTGAAATAELPCTVRLRLWSHDLKDPCSLLYPERCRLTIPNAVLCSEMGAHFSPCGRFLAACVACVLPTSEADPGFGAEVTTSPTRHPISAHKVIYELRVYSLEESTFGLVLASRAIRAAHCLTSIQFSPTSEHLLLAYGRRHGSLLKSVVMDGEMTVPIYTILEVYRVCDMELVRVFSSAEDEVNVACFHPSVACGLVYGTKEGKLRVLQHVSRGASSFSNENTVEEIRRNLSSI